MKFQVDVSRVYKNKTGYDAGGYGLNTSFQTETHTPDTFISSVVKAGWPYTMVHQKRSPEETGAIARGVKTPKHIENFVSQQLLTYDDDRGTPNVVSDWLNDPFFERYGYAFVESSSSKPEAQKGHAIFILDKPITDPDLYKDYLRAGCYKWMDRVDWLVNIDRTLYNGEDLPVHIVGRILPVDVFEREVLLPWRKNEKIKLQDVYNKKTTGTPILHGSDKLYESYITGYINWIINHLANKSKGSNRNIGIYWAGRTIAGIENTEWCKPYLHLLADVEDRVVEAAEKNGYLKEYANNNPQEIRRIYRIGQKVGGEELQPPMDNRVHQALSTVEPKLTHTQAVQAARIIETLADEKAWLKFNRLLKEYKIESGFPQPIADHFKFGFRPKSVDSDTGEILPPALTVPYYNNNTDVISVEYRTEDDGFLYEGLVSPYSVSPMFPEETSGIIIVPDSLTAVRFYLNGTNAYSVYGLPHANEFTGNIDFPDQDRFCIFDNTVEISLLEELNKLGVKFTRVSNVGKMLQTLAKPEIEQIVRRGKPLDKLI